MSPDTRKPSPRFSYVRYDEESVALQNKFREGVEELERLAYELPDGRAKSLFLTELEVAYMWVGKAVRDAQIARTGSVAEEPKRGEE